VVNTQQPPNAQTIRPDYRSYRLRVSRYDQVASMLLSLVILLGVAVSTLLIIWLTHQIFAGQAAVPVVLEELGTGDGALGESTELEAPGVEETDLEEPRLEETLATVADAVSSKVAMLDDPAVGQGVQSGHGDGRMAGTRSGKGGGGRRRHWEVVFLKGNTLEMYARQLDFFKIELGVLMPDNKLVLVSNLSKPKPDRQTVPADQEKRYYLTWRRGNLEQADRELLARAGVRAEGRLILKFLSPELESHLAGLEKARAGNEADNVRTTRFGIQSNADGFVFYVMEQTYKR